MPRHTEQDLKDAAAAQYSEHLKKVIKRVKRLLQRHNVAGSVVIYEPGFSEYLAVIDPIFSKVRFGDKPGQLVIQDDLAHYHGDEAHRKEALEATMNMLLHLASMNRLLFQNFNNMAHTVERKAIVKLPEAPVVQLKPDTDEQTN